MERKTWFVLLLVAVVPVLSSSHEQLQLTHSYPESDNYNLVTLICHLNGVEPSDKPQFLLNTTTDITHASFINVTRGEKSGSITFTFGQDGEGSFSCFLEEFGYSNSITLAGIILGLTRHGTLNVHGIGTHDS